MFKINHSSRPKEITHWVNFMGNKAKEIKELGSHNEEKRKRKKKRVRSPKNWDPKTHEGKKALKSMKQRKGPSAKPVLLLTAVDTIPAVGKDRRLLDVGAEEMAGLGTLPITSKPT